MVGFVVATSLFALFLVLRWRWRFGWRRRYGWGAHRYGLSRFLVRRLDATPTQEKVILSAIDELREPLQRAREEIKDSRRELADAFRQPSLDAAKIQVLLSRHLKLLEAAQAPLTTSLSRIHETLNEEQRRELARWIQWGPSRGGHCRPRRLSPAGIAV